MAIRIKSPNGDAIDFPDGTPDTTITDVMRREYGGPSTPAIAPLAEFRTRYPQYGDMDDATLGDALYSKFYSHMDRAHFNTRVGLATAPAGAKNVRPSAAPVTMSDDPEHDRSGLFFPKLPSAEPRTPPAGDVINRGTILPFVETVGADGKPQQGLGLPAMLSEPLEAANRLISRPAAPGTGDNAQLVGDAATVALSAGSLMAPRTARHLPTRETQDFAHALQSRIGPPAPPPASVPFVGPMRQAPVPQQSLAEMAADVGVELPRAAAGGRTAQIIGGSLKELPLVGNPIVRAAERANTQIEGAVTRVADELGPSSREGGGLGARDAIVGWMRGSSRDATRQAYDELDTIINPKFTVPLSKTEIAVRNIRARDQASATNDGAAAVALVENALVRPGGLTYEGIKGLRTSIIDRLDGNITGHGISQNNLRAIKAALDEDVRFAVQRAGVRGKGGKKALAAFERANREAFEAEGRREALTKIIGTQADASGEAIVDRITTMAGAKKGADIARVLQARAAMGSDAWEDVAGSILRTMGQGKDGFSLARWRSDFARLSDQGRTALFGSGPGSHHESLSKIFEISRHAEQLSRIGNPSQSGRWGAIITAPAWAIGHPASFLTAVIGGAVLSRALAKPITAKAAAKAMQAAKQHTESPTNATEVMLLQSVRQLAAAMGEDEAEAEARVRALLEQDRGRLQ